MWSGKVVFVFISFNINYVICFTISTNSNGLEQVKEHLDNPNMTKVPYQYSSNIFMKDNETHNNYSVDNFSFDNFTMHKRQKRQGSGAGKFTEAANMDQMKILRLFLQLFKNLVAGSPIGGSHPLHPDVPKPVIMLFKQKIGDFFFPPVGVDAIKD